MLSHSGGELNPALYDFVTLEKFKKGLATARNILVTKTGSMTSRFPTANLFTAKNVNEKIKIFAPSNSGYITEWGDQYVRGYDTSGTQLWNTTHSFLEADLPNLNFTTTGDWIYAFVAGKKSRRLNYVTGIFDPDAVAFAPTVISGLGISIAATGAPLGYAVNYLVTFVRNGEESGGISNISGSYNLPTTSSQYNTITGTTAELFADAGEFNEMRVYRRPHDGGAYGFIGSSTKFYDDGNGNLDCDFVDYGGAADFTNGPPESVTKLGLDNKLAYNLDSKTGIIYQQRLLISPNDDSQAILASRPGYLNNFDRDFPYDSDSALKFKSASQGNAEIYHMVDNNGLVVFTSVGVFVSVGTLSIDNVALEKRGGWVISETVPPLVVSDSVFFVDANTNSVRQLIYSTETTTYQAVDHSIFSVHLFEEKTIDSWALQEGFSTFIIVSFSDGTWASFTYDFEHQMRAWTRHDSVYPIEQVASSGKPDATYLVVNKDGQRYVEVTLPKKIPPATFASNPEADKINLNAFMDGIETQQNLLNDSLTGSDQFIVTPVTPGDWEGDLTLTCGTSALFPDPGLGAVGTIMRFFDTTDGTNVDLEVTSRASDNSVTVEPSSEFPSAQATGFRLYQTYTTVTGLTHLEGEDVGILSDGYVLASPYNDVDGFPTVTVSSGSITLPNSARGAIIVVGRPIAADIKTLNISTVAQKPTIVESLTVNKLYMRVKDTRGLFISNKFPEESDGNTDGTSVADMQDLFVQCIDNDNDEIIGNRYDRPISKRLEVILPGEWESNGQISIRQVDPVHFEILSLIPDVEVFHRSNR